MKYINFNKISLVLLVVFLSSCSGFLDKKPLGQLTSDNFFETEEQAVWATNAIYNQLRDWDVSVFSTIGLTDIISDDADKGSTPTDASFLSELDNFTFDAENIAFGGVWRGHFRGIYRANIVIDRIPEIEMDEGLKARLLGEARFLRAFFYFRLVRWFGDLPLIDHILKNDEYEQARVDKSEIYSFIIDDLNYARENLPAKYDSKNTGRITSGAATGLLAKVYLTIKDYQNAEKYAMEVINSGQYALYPSYQKLFMIEGENCEESIFEIQASAFETGGGGTQYNEVQGVRGTPNLGWGFNRPSDDLVKAYEPGDPRRDATILYPGEILPDGSAVVEDNPNILNERYNQKAWVPAHSGGNGNGPGNIRVLRYADILLIAAEALNENDNPTEALKYLNMVRARARGNNNFILKDISETDKFKLREIIYHERRVELAMEQHRWFDLIREGNVADIMTALDKVFIIGKHELMPIPQSEIDLSGGTMTQNPGY